MDEQLDALGHRESAAGLIRGEIGSISIVGRALTPDEEARLEALRGLWTYPLLDHRSMVGTAMVTNKLNLSEDVRKHLVGR